MQHGMIGYFVPHSEYPNGYHCDPKQPLPFAALASQKNHISVYLMSINDGSVEEAWFRKAWENTGRKLDMGKCCVRFKKLEDCALDVLGEAIRRVRVKDFIERYEKSIPAKSVATKRPAKTQPKAKAKSSTARKKSTARARPARRS